MIDRLLFGITRGIAAQGAEYHAVRGQIRTRVPADAFHCLDQFVRVFEPIRRRTLEDPPEEHVERYRIRLDPIVSRLPRHHTHQ